MTHLAVHEILDTSTDLDKIAVPASRDGDEATHPEPPLVIVLINRLKHRPRSARISVPDGTETCVTVPPGRTVMVGPVGSTAGEMRLSLAYPAVRGLRVAVVAVPRLTDCQTPPSS